MKKDATERAAEYRPLNPELWRLAALVGGNGRWVALKYTERVGEVARLLADAAQKLEWLEQEGLEL